MTTALQQLEQRLQQALSVNIVGLEAAVHALTIAIVARGHVLIQSVPGLGKTLLSKSLAAALGGNFKRIQGTADLMPSDIIGVHVFDGARASSCSAPGRCSPTCCCSMRSTGRVRRRSRRCSRPWRSGRYRSTASSTSCRQSFLVVATQNPRDFEGTYPLPESQLDRFMLRIDLDYPVRTNEAAVLERYGGVAGGASAVGGHRGSRYARRAGGRARSARIACTWRRSCAATCSISRRQRGEHSQVTLGLSTRGALALLRAARIAAGLRGADFVSPDDVKSMLPMVVAHRLVLSSEALLEGSSETAVLQRLSEQVAVPR